MNKIDCLLIASNVIAFDELERASKRLGLEDPFYKEIQMSYVNLNGKPTSIDILFDKFASEEKKKKGNFSQTEIFSNTIAYLGSYLNSHNLSFKYIKSFKVQKKELAKYLTENEVVSVAISTTYYMTSFPVIEIIRFIKKYNKKTKILVGGPLILNGVHSLLGDRKRCMSFLKEMNADYFIYNPQGEIALTKLIQAIKEGRSTDGIDNIICRNSLGEYVFHKFYNENVPLVENKINWRLFAEQMTSIVGVRTSISCMNRCAFCNFPYLQGKYQSLAVRLIKEELDQLSSIGGISRIYFFDDTLNYPVKRFEEFLDMLISGNFGFKWSCFLRCQYLDESIAKKMKLSGCESVFLGIESGCQIILDNMNKKVKVNDLRRGIELLKKQGIIIFASFIRGFPGETEETCQETDQFIEETAPDFYRIQTWHYSPNTPIEKQAEKYDLVGKDFYWKHKTMDSQTASNLVDESFKKIKNSIWLPQKCIDYPLIFLLLHYGVSEENMKKFIRLFNSEVIKKMDSQSALELSAQVIEKMKVLLQ